MVCLQHPVAWLESVCLHSWSLARESPSPTSASKNAGSPARVCSSSGPFLGDFWQTDSDITRWDFFQVATYSHCYNITLPSNHQSHPSSLSGNFGLRAISKPPNPQPTSKNRTWCPACRLSWMNFGITNRLAVNWNEGPILRIYWAITWEFLRRMSLASFCATVSPNFSPSHTQPNPHHNAFARGKLLQMQNGPPCHCTLASLHVLDTSPGKVLHNGARLLRRLYSNKLRYCTVFLSLQQHQ